MQSNAAHTTICLEKRCAARCLVIGFSGHFYASFIQPLGLVFDMTEVSSKFLRAGNHLYQAPPIFTILEIQDPSASEGILEISFALNEVPAMGRRKRQTMVVLKR